MKIGYIMQEGGPDVRQRPLTGPANHVLKVYQELHSLGHTMRLLARYDGSIWKSEDLETFEQVDTPRMDSGLRRLLERLVRGAQSRLRLPYVNFFESQRFAEACCRAMSDRDLLYERMGWMGLGTRIAARRLELPHVLEANNGDFITELEKLGVAPKGFQRWLAIMLMRSVARGADHVIATGEGHRKRFIDWHRVNPTKVTTVENGSDIMDLLEREQLRAFDETPASDRRITVLFVGAFEPWQGISTLLAAFSQVITRDSSIHLVLVGSGTQWAQINQNISDLGLQEYVELTGQLDIPQVAQRLAQADIGVAPYCGWMEYSGLKLFDYKSAGLAIVASGEGGQPATIEHGVTGWIVPPCEEQPLVEAIIKLAVDCDLRRRLGRSARAEAEKSHSWKHTAYQLSEVFEHVVRA